MSVRAGLVGSNPPVVMVDVAKHAGVSQKTVSRVVNNAPHVRPEVRERVIRAIKELGYRPNLAAQVLARERTHAIGVLATGSQWFGPSRRLFHLEQAARRHAYTLALVSLPDLSSEGVARGIEAILARGVEGVVIEVPSHLLELDALAGLPVVTSAGWVAGLPRQALVDVDQAGISARMTAYLLGLGHETVWHVAGPRTWDAAQNRLAGWRSALRAAGRRVPRALYGDWSARSGYELGRRLAARADVTAVFAANDQMAMGLLRAFGEAGRRIPAEVSIAGFDDIPEAEFQMVPLTTVAIDAEAAAERILAELIQMIEGNAPPSQPIYLGADLVIRNSTAPPLHHG
jgi:DNA-binding LacI/PurR family transcriptional regulator